MVTWGTDSITKFNINRSLNLKRCLKDRWDVSKKTGSMWRIRNVFLWNTMWLETCSSPNIWIILWMWWSPEGIETQTQRRKVKQWRQNERKMNTKINISAVYLKPCYYSAWGIKFAGLTSVGNNFILNIVQSWRTRRSFQPK